MRYLAVLLLVACGAPMTLDAGPEDGGDAGYDAGRVRVELTWQTPSCMACQVSAEVAASDVAGVRAGLNSTLNGWMCTHTESDAGLAIDCAYKCGQPPGTPDAGCEWVPCLGGPLECR